MRKRIISMLMAFALVLSLFPVTVFAEQGKCELTVQTVSGNPGSVVDVPVSIKNNPGVLGATFTISWDDGLTLVNCTNGEAWSELTFTPPGEKVSGCSFVWFAPSVSEVRDGTILNLSFRIPENAEEGSQYTICLAYKEQDIVDSHYNSVMCNVVNGKIQVFTFMPGDVNSDEKINPLDLIMLSQYIADGCKTNPNGYNVTVHVDAGNVNDDGRLNPLDLVFISQYIADGCRTNPTGYNVILKYPTPRCQHTMEAMPYKAATCTEDGNVAYWHCTACDKYFTNSDGQEEITLAETVLKATGHTIVKDPYVAPTYETVGWTEGSHCSVCGTVIVARQEIPALKKESYPIEYNLYDNDLYLMEHSNLENKNPASYVKGEGLRLLNLSTPGYQFDGWYDGEGNDSLRIREISPEISGPIQLYAHWTPIKYEIEFDSPDVPVPALEYTIDKGKELPNPECFGYTFMGWSIDGKIVSEIAPGTIPEGSNKIVVHANWTSDRNKAYRNENPDKPVIIEDMDNGRYLFLYQIGEIRNVPLHVNRDWGKVQNLNVKETVTVSNTVSETLAQSAATVVSNATTKSSAWTLSEQWNESSQAVNSHEEQNGRTDVGTHTDGTVKGGKYYIGNNSSGTTSISTDSGGSSSVSSKVTNQNSTGINGSYAKNHEVEDTVNKKHSVDIGVHGSIGTKPGKVKPGWKLSAGVDYNYTNDKKTTTTDKTAANISGYRNTFDESIGASSKQSHWGCTQNNTSSWNNSSGYEASQQESKEDKVSQSLSNIIYDKWKISSTIGHNSGNSSTNTTSDTTKLDNEYTSALEHSNEITQTRTEEVSYTSPDDGFYRHVTAGTVYVFAVVGYDIATRSYFTYTYNVLGHERHPYLDFSLSDANYKDCENGVLPFEVPYEVHEYVSSALAGSDGLEVDYRTGTITKYTGSDEYVTIPEYVSTNNKDGTYSAVKVTGINSDVFQGKTNIKGVAFPKYVNTIPEAAFKDCTALEEVICNGVSTIGKQAFSGCTKLGTTSETGTFFVDRYVTQLGDQAFTGIENLKVDAATANVADSAAHSGATNLTLRLNELSEAYDNREISIGTDVNVFRLWDNGTPRSNLCVHSNAAYTELNHITFINNRETPVVVDSGALSLNRVTITNAPGLAMVLSSDITQIDLYGDVRLTSSGKNTLLSKKIVLSQNDPSVKGTMYIAGNILTTDPEIQDSRLLELTKGNIVQIGADHFNDYLRSYVLHFHGNGGNVTPAEKSVEYGQAYGELPVPVREYYHFDGWFTLAEGGDAVTAATTLDEAAEQNLYAHWTRSQINVAFDPNGGVVSTTEKLVSCGAAYGTLPVPTRTGYNFNGWYTSSHDGSKVEAGTICSASSNLTLYAHWSVKSYHVSWASASDYQVKVQRTSSPYGGASSGVLSNGAVVYYGDTLTVTYTPNAGYQIKSQGLTQATVTKDLTGSDIFASTSNQLYHVSWKNAAGCSITVERTESPRGGSCRVLENGSEIYYGDVLQIRYQANQGYTLKTQGKQTITVQRNITDADIYASASANTYTYRVLYRSTNGTDLGSTQISHSYGTAYVVSAPAKSGYRTPASQEVHWDSVNGKEIVFRYEPEPVSNPVKNGKISDLIESGHKDPTVSCTAKFEYRNRDSNSVEVRVVFTETIHQGYSYNVHRARVSLSGKRMADVMVVKHKQWAGTSGNPRTGTATTEWFRIPLGTTNATTVTFECYFYDSNLNGADVSNISPGYANLTTHWDMMLPAY